MSFTLGNPVGLALWKDLLKQKAAITKFQEYGCGLNINFSDLDLRPD